jgi:hypothetical protein
MNEFKCFLGVCKWNSFVSVSFSEVSVEDDILYDACKTANIKIEGRQNLVKWALTCFGGSKPTHKRL